MDYLTDEVLKQFTGVRNTDAEVAFRLGLFAPETEEACRDAVAAGFGGVVIRAAFDAWCAEREHELANEIGDEESRMDATAKFERRLDELDELVAWVKTQSIDGGVVHTPPTSTHIGRRW